MKLIEYAVSLQWKQTPVHMHFKHHTHSLVKLPASAAGKYKTELSFTSFVFSDCFQIHMSEIGTPQVLFLKSRYVPYCKMCYSDGA